MRERQLGARNLEFVGGGAGLALLENGFVRDEQLVAKVRHHLPGVVFKAHRLLYHSTLGLRVIIEQRRSDGRWGLGVGGMGLRVWGSHPLGFGGGGLDFGGVGDRV